MNVFNDLTLYLKTRSRTITDYHIYVTKIIVFIFLNRTHFLKRNSATTM